MLDPRVASNKPSSSRIVKEKSSTYHLRSWSAEELPTLPKTKSNAKSLTPAHPLNQKMKHTQVTITDTQLRATRLSALTLSKPKSGSVKGSLATKGGNYILEGAGGEPGAPGAEMDGLSLMVPHLSRGGRLYRGELR